MFSDYKSSIRSILHERTTSPLYGAFFISWITCNWKIVYLTLFVSEEKLQGNKIDYIAANYWDVWNLVVFPLIGAVVLIGIIPLVSVWAYRISLYYELRRIKHKENADSKRRLTIEQSVALRRELLDQDEKFQKSLANKDQELQKLQ